jgi:hypothetical protein
VVAAGVAERDQDRVPAIGGEPAIGLVNDLRLGHDGAILQGKFDMTKLLSSTVAKSAGIGTPHQRW